MQRLGSWNMEYMLRFSFDYLSSGFRLNLFTDDELNCMYYVIARILRERIRNEKVRLYSAVLHKAKGKKGKKGKPKKKIKSNNTSWQLKLYEVQHYLCLAMFHVRMRSTPCVEPPPTHHPVCAYVHPMVVGTCCWLQATLAVAQEKLLRQPAVSKCDPAARFYHRVKVFEGAPRSMCPTFEEYTTELQVRL